MGNHTSSAKILYGILIKAWEVSNKSSYSLWNELLEGDASKISIPEKITQLIQLVSDAKEEIRVLSVDESEKEIYINAVNEVEEFIYKGYLLDRASNSWNAHKEKIDSRSLALINAAGSLTVSEKKGLTMISPEELTELLEKVRSLIDEVCDKRIDEEIKSFLVAELRKVENSILTYHIRGSSGIAKASSEVSGKIFARMCQDFPKKTKECLQNALFIVTGIGVIVTYTPKVLEALTSNPHQKLPEEAQKVIEAYIETRPQLKPGIAEMTSDISDKLGEV